MKASELKDAALKEFKILSREIENLQDVVDWGLCTGCGACYYFCERRGITLENVSNVGIRPHFTLQDCVGCTKCLSVCPGYFVDASAITANVNDANADREFGPALEIWEGYALDPEIRFRGSSGGVLSALALYCLEQEGMQFVLHTGADGEQPWLNRTVKSTTRAEILSRTGSRYAPSSPCDSLGDIEDGKGLSVFIGKPCDTAAVGMLRQQRPKLDAKLGLVLTFFCAGTPSTMGTLDLVASLNVNHNDIHQIRYRGDGWPGSFKVQHGDQDSETSLSYADSWRRLTAYRPLRCNLCPDGLGRVADIACGDAWERCSGDGDPGQSVIIVRTQRGKQALHRAIAAGYVQLERVDALAVFAAQPQLLQRRRELFGRLLGMRLLAVPTPIFAGFSLFHCWIRQPLLTQVRSVLGTIRRFVQRAWWKRRPVAAG